MVVRILLVLAVAIALFLAYASTRPDTFRIERSIAINATSTRVAALLVDFHEWMKWSPWEKLDPTMQRKFGGPTSGVGANYEWFGNKNVGSGRMEILQIDGTQRVLIKLDFTAPMQANNTTEFALTENNGVTQLTWAMYGKNGLMQKVAHIFMDIDKMVGKDFEKGLADLKSIAEKNL